MAQQDVYISFDDVNNIVTIKTPGGNVIELSDTSRTIVLRDQNANTVTLSPSGIDIFSPNDVNIRSDQNINLKAQMNVAISASAGDATMRGINLDLLADASAKLQGSAAAELSASGETTIKGAMIMIN